MLQLPTIAGSGDKALVANPVVDRLQESSETLKSLGMFRIDTGSDLFSRPVPDFNVLDPKYSDVQLAKNLELVKKSMNDQAEIIDVTLETISRFVRAQTYSFTDPEYGLHSVNALMEAIKTEKKESSAYYLLAQIASSMLRGNNSRADEKNENSEISQGIGLLKNSDQPFAKLLKGIVEAYYLHSPETEKTLLRLLKEKSNDPHFHYAMGSVFLALEEISDFSNLMMHAPRSFEIALILTSSDDRLLNRITNKFVDLLEKYDREKREAPLWLTEYTYKKLIQMDPENPVSRNNLGYFYANLNIKLEEALENCEKAVSLDPENPYFLDSLGWVLFRLGRFTESMEKLEKACALNSQVPEIRGHLANVHFVLGNKKKSIEELRNLVLLDPDNATARNNLGFLLADLNMDYNEALENCSRAVALAPDDPVFTDSLGWVHFKLGNLPEAVRLLEKAISMKPSMAEAMVHLSNALMASEETDRAIKLLERAIGCNPLAEGLTEAAGLAFALKTMENTIHSNSGNHKGRTPFAVMESMAQLCEAKGLAPRALKHYRELQKNFPDNPNLKLKISSLQKISSIINTDNFIQISADSPTVIMDRDLDFLPSTTLQFTKINRESIIKILSALQKNFSAMESMNLKPLLPIFGRDVIQFLHSENEINYVTAISFFNAEERNNVLQAMRTLATLLNLFRSIPLEERIISNENLTLWTVKGNETLLTLYLGSDKLVLSNSHQTARNIALNKKPTGNTLISDKIFGKLWAANPGIDPQSTVFISGDLIRNITLKYPVFGMIKELEELQKIAGVLERIRLSDRDTLIEDYSILPLSSNMASKVTDYLNSIMEIAKPVYESEGMNIAMITSQKNGVVQASLTIKGFLRISELIKKQLKNNSSPLLRLIRGLKSIQKNNSSPVQKNSVPDQR
jgi:tetratricopeptide (TPR) repeat protein